MVETIEVFGDGLKELEKGNLIVFKRWLEKKAIKIGEMVELVSEDYVIGCGLWDKIGVRVLSFNPCPSTVEELIREKINTSRKIRERIGYVNVYRLIHGDGDLFPGLIVDVYGPLGVIQSSSAAVDVHVETIAEIMKKELGVSNVAEKSVQRVRSKAKLTPRERMVIGNLKEVVVEVDIEGVKYKVSVKGRKTGLYLDQRENRVFVQRISGGERFLDLFSYTGGFGLNALMGGAKSVTFVDKDKEALALLKENLKLNGIVERKVRIVNADAWEYLKRAVKRKWSFDVSSADPPALMDDRKDGLMLYKSAYALTREITKTTLVPSSCSRSMSRELFLRTLYDSLSEPYRILEVRGSAPDHPVRRGIEDYLKTAFVSLT